MERLRAEFLATFDTITSHMETTFSALSTALSRCSNFKDSTITRAYLAIFLGPSLGSAKSKVILGIDGLEKRIWGNHVNVSSSEGDESEEQDVVSETDADSAEGPDESESDGSEEEYEEKSEDEDEDDCKNIGGVSSPPLAAQSSYAIEQRFLQNAERLLSRTLAAADADGRGIISEMCTFFLIKDRF